MWGVGGCRGWRGVLVAPRLAWVRCGSEFYLAVVTASCIFLLQFLVFVRFLAVSFFLPFSSYTVQARYSGSVYVRPVCINALFVPEPFLPTLI
jgi:hypothetical protein